MKEHLKKIKRYQVLFLILAIAVMVTIFILSSQDADRSSDTSSTLTRIAIKLMYRDYDAASPERQREMWSTASFIVRKLAHFSIYTALGLCVSGAAGKRRLFSPKSAGVVIFGLIYAVSDEFHQHFVPGRSCEFRDMMIDTGGVLTGMLISFVLMGIAGFIAGRRRHGRNK